MGRSPGLLEVFGDAYPVVVEAVDLRRRWAAICLATSDTDGDGRIFVDMDQHGGARGDRLEPYLVTAAHGAVRIEAFLAASVSGDHIAFVDGGRLTLYDVERDSRTELGHEGLAGAEIPVSLRDLGVASFDDGGNKLLYLSKTQSGMKAMVREFTAGTEVELAYGEGRLRRAEIDRSGAWAVFDVEPGGVEERQRPASTLAASPCRGIVTSWSSFPRGRDLEQRFAPTGGGMARAVPGAVAVLGRSLLVRRSDGALELVGERGDAAELVPASCGGRLLHGDPVLGRVLVACTRGHDRIWPLAIYGTGERTTLSLLVSSFDADHTRWSPGMLFAPRLLTYIKPGAGAGRLKARAVDMKTMKVLSWNDDERILATAGRAILMRDGDQIRWDDADSGETRHLARVGNAQVVTFESGRYLGVGNLLIGTESGTVLGRFTERPLRISEDGRVLVPARRDGLNLTGPLRWAPLAPVGRKTVE